MVTETSTRQRICGKFILWSDAEIEIIRLYFKGKHENTVFIQNLILERFGTTRTYYAIRHKATELGLTRHKGYSFWTPQQEAQLEGLAGKYTANQIANRIGRSVNSVHDKCYKMGISLGIRHRDGWYTLDDVNKIFGISENTLYRWMRSGMLQYSFFSPHVYKFSTKDLKAFIQTYPVELTGRNVDMVQIVQILCSRVGKTENGRHD